jgi:cytoplasmic iron level regulating protein YaaA (DUF328/UPF0246 family)
MRILLPPSEAKTAGGRGRRLSARPDESIGPLAGGRAQTMAALQQLLARGRASAATGLLLPPAVVDDSIAANAGAHAAPTTPALNRYTGVVYLGLSAATLSGPARRVAERSVLIFSGLFGVVRGNEGVPNYRVPGKANLPGLGIASTFWRPILDDVLPPLLGSHLVIDLRSGDYLAMWRPPRELAARVVSVRVLSPRPGTTPGVISYPSKFGKGQLTRALVEREAAGQKVRTVDDVAAAWLDCGGRDAAVRPGGLDLLLG